MRSIYNNQIGRFLSNNTDGDLLIHHADIRPGVKRKGVYTRRTAEEMIEMEKNIENYRKFYEENPGESPFNKGLEQVDLDNCTVKMVKSMGS